MKKNKTKVNSSAEKEFVFEFRAGEHNCVLKVPLQFPAQENLCDLHGRLVLLHKIPCYIEDGETAARLHHFFVFVVLSYCQVESTSSREIPIFLNPKHKHLNVFVVN